MPLTKAELTGFFPALPTPIDAAGRLDSTALRGLVNYLFDGGMTGVVSLGGTGEYLALLPEERIETVEATVKAVQGRGPVIAGVLAPGFREAVRTGRELMQAGADALMLVTPFYVSSSQSAIREYYKAYFEEVGAPVLLYEIPYKTMVSLQPETVAAIADDGSVIGMKACNTDINQFARLIALAGEKIAILSGEDHLLPIQLAIGAAGSIHATFNLFPRLWGEIYAMAAAGDLPGSLKEMERLRPMMNAVFAEGNPGPLKAALAMAGLPVGDALRPLCPPGEQTRQRLSAVLPELFEREKALAARQTKVSA